MYYAFMVSGAKQGKLAELLYSVMAKRNISTQALASIVGVQRQTCYAWLHEYQQPRLNTLRRLAVILNIPLAELIAASYADVEGTRLDSLLQVYLDLPEDKRRVLEDEETTERYLNLGLDYTQNPGSESLRQAVSSLYTTLKAEDIQITSGASEALFLLTWVLMEPGANIVVEEPCYENLPGVASALGFEVRRLPLRMEDGWRPNLEQVARLIDEKTRPIYLVHPHNPTGSTLQVEEMQAIAQMAERVGALVVNDELFRLIALDGEPIPSIIDIAENAICIGDMTKPWGLGGLRIGWIASRNHRLLQRVSEARDYSTMCSSAPGAFLAEVALRHASQLIAPRLTAARVNREQLAQAIAQAKAHFQGLPIWQRPQASYTAFVQLPFPAEAFCRHLALERRILLLPGSVFGLAYENFIRIGLGGDTHQFQEGMSIMLDELLRWRECYHMRG